VDGPPEVRNLEFALCVCVCVCIIGGRCGSFFVLVEGACGGQGCLEWRVIWSLGQRPEPANPVRLDRVPPPPPTQSIPTQSILFHPSRTHTPAGR
jgi:hypothetical protein